jgi:hypothetical protein
MKQLFHNFGVDWHTWIGATGMMGFITIGQYNAVIGAIGCTATAIYMCLRAGREWFNINRDRAKKQDQNDKNELKLDL